MRNRDKDTIAKAKEEAQHNADLRHISRGVDEIRIDMRAHNKKTDEQMSEMMNQSSQHTSVLIKLKKN